MAAPVGVTSSFCTPLNRWACPGAAARWPGGHGKNAVSHFRGAAADIQRRAGKARNRQKWKPMQAPTMSTMASTAPTHGNGFFDGHVVDGGFGLAEFAKNGGGVLADVIGECGLLQDTFDGGERAVRVRFLRLHADVRGGHAVLQTFPRGFPSRGRRGRLVLRADVPGHAGMEQCAEGHVPADSAKAVKIGEFHFAFDFPPVDTICCGSSASNASGTRRVFTACRAGVEQCSTLRGDGKRKGAGLADSPCVTSSNLKVGHYIGWPFVRARGR